ncbi:MAG: nucleotidyltransferase domain-containing protein [Bacteroidetes bacterium]|nr:nucleotidyltransferase domain-containing protein [Bacteroidota bacterium]MBU1578757.1 nucleotidyltransferase domain-containing protein [Bacteroidota bacterium]MBU2465606.1 nucleotidyltransferase domain-containing protein [Bacteroidota bacterium]MBU2558784.1 nucleotidyltransferase domain-containing protein [Bacteroidota bacterium]
MRNDLNVGLNINDLESIRRVIKSFPKIEDAVLFGSRAKGTYSNGSDIDIALKGGNMLLNDMLDLSNALEELLLPYKFDLIIYDRITESALIDHINKVGISLM